MDEAIAKRNRISIAIEGKANDIVPITCERLELEGFKIAYRHENEETDLTEPDEIDKWLRDVGAFAMAEAEIGILCNMRGYREFMEYYDCFDVTKPLVILTGGGDRYVQRARAYTEHVYPVPFCESNPVVKGWNQFADILEEIAKHGKR